MSLGTKMHKAFTAVELIIALAFISSLLLIVAVTVIQISNMYSRGITIKAVNQAGTTISTDLQKSIETSMPFSVDVSSTQYVRDNQGGRLCLNTYSYIWNYGNALNAGTATNKYASGNLPIRLVKIRDPGGSYCLNPKSNISTTDAIDLLNSGDRTLAVQSFDIKSESGAYDKLTNSRLYTVSFRVGTNKKENLTADYFSCLEPGQIGSDLSYCSVEMFTFAVMSGNKYER